MQAGVAVTKAAQHGCATWMTVTPPCITLHSHNRAITTEPTRPKPLMPEACPHLAVDEVQATLAEVLLVRLRLCCVVEGTQAGHQVSGVLQGHMYTHGGQQQQTEVMRQYTFMESSTRYKRGAAADRGDASRYMRE